VSPLERHKDDHAVRLATAGHRVVPIDLEHPLIARQETDFILFC
jgi:hypothetical protein